MGNSPSQSQDEHLYKNYIDKQFNTIQQQQNQITQLISNMQTNNSPNNSAELEKLKRLNKLQKIKYVQDIEKIKKLKSQQQQIPNGQQQIPNGQQQIPNGQQQIPNKLNPYKILNLGKNYDKNSLKKAYLKAALSSHPDRGGTQEQFQQVSIAYAVLMKKFEGNQYNDHEQLKKSYENKELDTGQQKMTNDNFDVNVFNKVYSENRMEDIYDKGYGDWFKRDGPQHKTKMFQGEFNKDLFNREFETYKKTNVSKSKDLAIREPTENISYTGSDSIVSLGQKNVKNFSGESGGLGYRDLKDAYENSTLIDINSVDISNRDKDIHAIKSSRTNINYKMSNGDLQRQTMIREREQIHEKDRIDRIKNTDQRIFNDYQRIHNRLRG
jgi:curved DNA-binding protein CbpA